MDFPFPMKLGAIHKLVGRPPRTACGIDDRRRWRRWSSMQITGTREERLVTCKRCLKK
jgi:hypothetical protein